MSRHEKSHLDAVRISRRTLFQGMIALGTELYLPIKKTSGTINEVQKNEEQVGDRAVTLEEARAYAPLLSNLYTEFIQPEKSSDEFIAQTFVIHPVDYTTQDVRYRSDAGDIPELVSTPLSPEFVLASFSPPEQMGLTFSTGNMYIFLERINELHTPQQQGITSSHTQFHSFEPTTQCEQSTPITRLRQTVLHEHAHSDLKYDNTLANTRGFRIINEDGKIVEYFEEFFADFTAAAISNHYDLPFNTGYGFEPSDFSNFQHVMEQSGLSLQQMATLHRNSDLFTFIKKISEGMQLKDSSRKFNDAVYEVSEALFKKPNHHPDWEDIEPYFADIDSREYHYDPPVPNYPEKKEPLQGCIYQKNPA